MAENKALENPVLPVGQILRFVSRKKRTNILILRYL